ncbi:MAG: insulinase family protein [Verrucomicrobiales bacterium]|nr:insulinase family protein [Verrucomicrobiales bacterium]
MKAPRLPLLLALGLTLGGMFARSLSAAEDAAPLPVDPAVTIGRLDNGLTYYLRENHKPENRATLRLVVNAGSVLEADDQQGLAHFLEHMAFNGTKHFAKQALVDFLEGIGMRFGADLNAYTSFDETVFLLEIPMDNAEVIDKAFLILADWAGEVTLASEDIEAERGVVMEEWRLGQGAEKRVMDRQIPVLLHDSRYAERLPIGRTNIIETAPREAFTRFYHDWYRPDLMAVVIVGDFNRADMERRLKEHFDGLRNPSDERPRSLYPVPDHRETLFSIVTDPELPYSSIEIAYKHPAEEDRTRADYRLSLVENLYSAMLNERLEERTREAAPPYLYAGMGKAAFVRTKDVFVQTAAVKEGAWAEGLRAMLLEARRVQRDGFTASELERAKANLARSYEQAFAERDKQESTSFAGEYTRNFLRGEPIPGIAAELDLVRDFLPGITLDEVNTAAGRLITPTNRVILYSAPEKAGVSVPTEADILAVLHEAEAADVEAYRDELADAPLLDPLPEPRAVVRSEHIESIDLTLWVLANGARVWARPTDFKNDQVLMTASSPGGTSVVSDEDFVPAVTAPGLIGQSGVGAYDETQLRKKLAGKLVGVRASIGETTEGMTGTASPRDLETLFQLIHLYFTQPRADDRVFAATQTRLRDAVANRLNDPDEVFADELEVTLYGANPRHQPLSAAWIGHMDLERSLAVYRDRFANAGDFDFVFVGNFDPEMLKGLCERYLATLPSLDRPEAARFNGDDPVRGDVILRVFKGVEDKAAVQLLFAGDTPWREEDRLPVGAAVEVLRIRLRETLREEQGGVYGVGVSGGIQRWPKGTYSGRIAFGCDPARIDELVGVALAEVRSLQETGPRPEDLAKVKEIQLRTFERGQRENPFWLGNLEFRVRNDLDPAGILRFPDRVRDLTPEQVRNAARTVFSTGNLVTARLEPAGTK